MFSKSLSESAKDGNKESQYILGVALFTGDGCPADADKAAEWFSRSADQGYLPAKRELGIMHLTGEGRDVDPAKAYGLISEAAGNMDPNAVYHLAMMYEKGVGVKRDLYESVKLLAYAAGMNYPGAEEDAERVAGLISEERNRKLRSRPLLHLDISEFDAEAACCKDMLAMMLDETAFIADTYKGPELICTDENGEETVIGVCPFCGKKVRRVRHDKIY